MTVFPASAVSYEIHSFAEQKTDNVNTDHQASRRQE